MIRNHGIIPKPSKSKEQYYRSCRKPEPNVCLLAAAACAIFILGVIIGSFIQGI